MGSIPNFFLCFGMNPEIIDVHPKLIPKGGVVQFCQYHHFNCYYYLSYWSMVNILTQQDDALRNFTSWMANDIVITISFISSSSQLIIIDLWSRSWPWGRCCFLDKSLEVLLNLKPAAKCLYNITVNVLHQTFQLQLQFQLVWQLICWSSRNM